MKAGFHRRMTQESKKRRATALIKVVFFHSAAIRINAPADLFKRSFIRRDAWLQANAGADWKDAYPV